MHVVMAGGTGEEPGCMEKVLQLANDLTKHADIQRISRRFTAATTRSRDIPRSLIAPTVTLTLKTHKLAIFNWPRRFHIDCRNLHDELLDR